MPTGVGGWGGALSLSSAADDPDAAPWNARAQAAICRVRRGGAQGIVTVTIPSNMASRRIIEAQMGGPTHCVECWPPWNVAHEYEASIGWPAREADASCHMLDWMPPGALSTPAHLCTSAATHVHHAALKGLKWASVSHVQPSRASMGPLCLMCSSHGPAEGLTCPMPHSY